MKTTEAGEITEEAQTGEHSFEEAIASYTQWYCEV